MLRDRKTGTEKETTVAEYFAKVVGVRLEFPALQCVLVRLQPLCLPVASPLEAAACASGQAHPLQMLHVMQPLPPFLAQRVEERGNECGLHMC